MADTNVKTNGVTSEGIRLFRNNKEIENVQDIPELGGSKEAIEITCLKDKARRYTDGIENYGDSIPFNILYDKTQFNDLESTAAETDTWKVILPDGTGAEKIEGATCCTFGGKGSVKLNGVGVNGAITFTLSIRPNTKLTWGTHSATPGA